ncbi:MAG: addiction module antidote protein, HigA family [Candidatus Omnitrophota bacterium]|nr:MAG: addiction module antidote protein, HigA family [Candidatus Omnitrophota bacterium]
MNRIPTHPGEILKDELEAREISINGFARSIGVTSGRISQIIQGKRSVTPNTALRLARYFGNSPEFWMNLQVHYDLAIAQRYLDENSNTQVVVAR